MRLGTSRKNRSLDELAFLASLEQQECETMDATECAVYADCREENGESGQGYRRLAECKTAGAFVTAYRVVADELLGVSPVELARSFAGKPWVGVAEGDGAAFVCGRKALEAIKEHPRVKNYDDFPALYAGRLPAHYREPEVLEALRRGAFQVANISGKSVYIFNTVEILTGTLTRLPLGAVAW